MRLKMTPAIIGSLALDVTYLVVIGLELLTAMPAMWECGLEAAWLATAVASIALLPLLHAWHRRVRSAAARPALGQDDVTFLRRESAAA